MERDEYNKLFDLGITIRDQGLTLKDAGNLSESNSKFWEAIKLFEKLYPIDAQPDKFNKCLILGGLYVWVAEHEKAYRLFSNAVSLDSSSEIASLCLYLASIEIGKSDFAVEELTRFLNLFPAKLYMDTLEELIEEIDEGRLPLYKDKILSVAAKNGIRYSR